MEKEKEKKQKKKQEEKEEEEEEEKEAMLGCYSVSDFMSWSPGVGTYDAFVGFWGIIRGGQIKKKHGSRKHVEALPRSLKHYARFSAMDFLTIS